MLRITSVVLLVLSVFLLTACSNQDENPSADASISQPSTLPTMPNRAKGEEWVIVDGMPKMLRTYNCTACHAIDKEILGPTLMEVAKKYKGDAGAEDKLIIKISKGGSGVWGSAPMPANDTDGTRQADIREMVRYILGLAK